MRTGRNPSRCGSASHHIHKTIFVISFYAYFVTTMTLNTVLPFTCTFLLLPPSTNYLHFSYRFDSLKWRPFLDTRVRGLPPHSIRLGAGISLLFDSIFSFILLERGDPIGTKWDVYQRPDGRVEQRHCGCAKLSWGRHTTIPELPESFPVRGLYWSDVLIGSNQLFFASLSNVVHSYFHSLSFLTLRASGVWARALEDPHL